MAGILELRCGPSGIGKTSSLENIAAKPFTYTTRRKRNEKDSKTRRFVSDDEFRLLLKEKKIVAPYEVYGNRYGFSIEITEEVLNGNNVSEQITPHFGFKLVEGTFQEIIPIKKILFLSDINEIRRRVIGREFRRIREQYQNVLDYIDDIDSFDIVNISRYNLIHFGIVLLFF
jgi:guanylate kinase